MFRKMLYVLAGFVIGFVAATFFSASLFAQMGSKSYTEDAFSSNIPSNYGRLVGVSGLSMYFEASDGTIYIVRQRTQNDMDSRVSVIKRGE